MISIYCTTPFYLKDCYLTTIVERLTEEELLNLVKEDRNAIWFVQPHGSSTFRTKFMDGCLDKDGYVIEGVFHTELCGEPVDYRVIEDINTNMARETQRVNMEHNGKTYKLGG